MPKNRRCILRSIPINISSGVWHTSMRNPVSKGDKILTYVIPSSERIAELGCNIKSCVGSFLCEDRLLTNFSQITGVTWPILSAPGESPRSPCWTARVHWWSPMIGSHVYVLSGPEQWKHYTVMAHIYESAWHLRQLAMSLHTSCLPSSQFCDNWTFVVWHYQ